MYNLKTRYKDSFEENRILNKNKDLSIVILELSEVSEQITQDRKLEKYKLNIFNDNALKVELLVNYQLSQYQNLTTQQVILEKIQSQLPNIASGKIKLPTTPELSKKPEVSISTSIEQSKGKGLDL